MYIGTSAEINQELGVQVIRSFGWPAVGERVKYVRPENTLWESDRGRNGLVMRPVKNKRVERTGVIERVSFGFMAVTYGSVADVDYNIMDDKTGERFEASGNRIERCNLLQNMFR